MSDHDNAYLPKYHQQPLVRPLFGQRPRIKLEILSHWAARFLFFSFYTSLFASIALQFYYTTFLWDCQSACGNSCGRLPTVSLQAFGTSCAAYPLTPNVTFGRIDPTRLYPAVPNLQLTHGTCSQLDPFPRNGSSGRPLAGSWQGVPVYLSPLNRHLVVAVVVRNTPQLAALATALPPDPPYVIPSASFLPSMASTPIARLRVNVSFLMGSDVSCLSEHFWLFCPSGQKLCNSMQVITLNDVVRGDYQVNVTLDDVQWVPLLPDNVLSQATQSIFAASGMNVNVAMFFNRQSYVLILIGVRYGLFALAIGWLWRYLWQLDFRRPTAWLPEQGWLLAVQIGLILYLNPFFVPSLLDRNITDNWSARLYFFFEHPFQNIFVNFERAFEIVLLESVRGGVVRVCGLVPFPAIISLFWFICTVAPTIIQLHYHGWTYTTWNYNLMQLPALVDTVDSLAFWSDQFLTWLWFLWIFKSILATYQQLKKLPYLQTRWRQLSFRFYVLIYSCKVLQYVVLDFYQFFKINAGVVPTTVDDPPAPGVGDFIKNSVTVFLFVYAYTPAATFQTGGPPAPGLRWWTKIKWPDKWLNWLARNGSAMYFFLYESEKLEYLEAQRRLHPDHDPSLVQTLLENMGEFRDYIWENVGHFRAGVVHASLRVMTIPTQVRGMLSHILHKPPAFTPQSGPPEGVLSGDEEDASVEMHADPQKERVQSFREETEAAKPFSIANPFYCVELAVEMWNLSWEVYFQEPPDFRPHRLLSSAEAAAVAVLPRFKSDGHVSRRQYLHNSVNSLRGHTELPERGVHLTISHWPLPAPEPTAPMQAIDPKGKAQPHGHGRSNTSASLTCSDYTEWDANTDQASSSSRLHTLLAKPRAPVPPFALSSPLQAPHVAASLNSARPTRPPVFPGLPSRVRLEVPAPLVPTASRLTWPPVLLRLHGGNAPEPGDTICCTPLRVLVSFLADSDARAFGSLCRATRWLIAEWRATDPPSLLSPRSGVSPSLAGQTRPDSQILASGASPNALSVPVEEDQDPDGRHIRGPSEVEEVILQMVAPSFLQQLERALKPKPKKREKRRLVWGEHMDLRQYGYELRAVINWNNNQAIVCENATKIVVAFRGTINMDNVVTDVKFYRTPVVQMLPHSTSLKQLFTRFGFDLVPKAHSGFYEAYNCLRADTLRAVQALALARPNKPICCTGHSLGGALAIFAAYDISKMFEGREVTMYNFGGPRVGNNTFRLLYNLAVPDSYRTVNDQDVVPTFPPPITLLGGMFHHVGKEVRIDSKGNMIIQPTFLEKSFVGGSRRIGPHKMENYKRSLEAVCMYFGMELSMEKMPHRLLLPDSIAEPSNVEV